MYVYYKILYSYLILIELKHSIATQSFGIVIVLSKYELSKLGLQLDFCLFP